MSRQCERQELFSLFDRFLLRALQRARKVVNEELLPDFFQAH